MNAAESLKRRARWRWPEIVFWLVAFGALFVPSGKHLILNEVAIFALFALSLDLILGYAGIVSLGHAAFFGLGAYAAGILCKTATPDPLIGLAVAIGVSALMGLLTSLLVLRGTDMSRLAQVEGVVVHQALISGPLTTRSYTPSSSGSSRSSTLRTRSSGSSIFSAISSGVGSRPISWTR